MLRKSNRRSNGYTLFALLAMVLMSVCLVAGVATAQKKGQGKDRSQQMQNVRQKMKNNRSKLKKIQQKVMQDNPELQQRGRDLQKMQRRKMREYAGKNATRKESFEAMMKARQDKEVQEKMGKFRKDLVEKMKQEDPKTEQYIQEIQSAARKMRNLKQQGSQQGGARTVQ
jgi:Na+-transporting NADH:ubiquinone oxidoreductase subunit NqrC